MADLVAPSRGPLAPLWAVGPTLLGLSAVLAERALQVGAGLSSYVFAGVQALQPYPPLPDELRPAVSLQGYDGLAFYVLALDPFSSELIIGADDPGYRQQRIFFPFLAWLTATVSSQSVLVTLVLVNVVAACVSAWLAAVLAMRWGRHPAWGAVVGLAPPVVVGTMYNTAEPLALALMVGGIVAALDRRPLLVAVLLSASVLTRETTLMATVGLIVWLVAERARTCRVDVTMLAAAVVPVFVFGLWQLTLRHIWGEFPVVSGGGSRVGSVPVVDVLRSIASPVTVDEPTLSVTTQGLWWAGRILMALAILGGAVAIVRRMKASGSLSPDLLTVLFFSVAAPTLATGAWLWTRQYTRSAGEWLVVSALLMIRTPGPTSNVGMVAMMLTSGIAVVL